MTELFKKIIGMLIAENIEFRLTTTVLNTPVLTSRPLNPKDKLSVFWMITDETSKIKANPELIYHDYKDGTCKPGLYGPTEIDSTNLDWLINAVKDNEALYK